MPSGNGRRLIEHVKTAVACGNYRSGDKLPTLRVFAEKFALSLAGARKAMLELAEAGLVEIRRSDGVYVRNGHNAAATPAHRIAIFIESPGCLDPNRTYSSHALRGFQEEAEKHNCRVDIHFQPFYKRSDRLVIPAGELAGADAIAFFGTFDWRGVEYPPGIPAVGISMGEMNDGMLSCVGIDPFGAAELAAEFFQRRGVETVAVFANRFGYGKRLTSLFRELWKQTEIIELADNHPDPALPADRTKGYLFPGGTACEMTIQGYRRLYGRELIDDAAVLSCDGKSRFVPGYAPVSTIGIDWVEAGRNALAEVLYRLAHPTQPGRRLLMYPDLLEVNQNRED